jgi:hypothetical protein
VVLACERVNRRASFWRIRGEYAMKKVIMAMLGFMVFVTLGTWAQAAPQKTNESTNVPRAEASINSTGMVSSDGKTFVADKDKKHWTIDNPGAVKADEGHHVRLQGDETATDTLHVKSAKMMGKTKAGSQPK